MSQSKKKKNLNFPKHQLQNSYPKTQVTTSTSEVSVLKNPKIEDARRHTEIRINASTRDESFVKRDLIHVAIISVLVLASLITVREIDQQHNTLQHWYNNAKEALHFN